MEHKHSNWPFVAILLFVGFLYFSFEVVKPYAERQESFNRQCEKAGGTIIGGRDYQDLCFKKDALIEIKK